jgi:hypothetical protein
LKALKKILGPELKKSKFWDYDIHTQGEWVVVDVYEIATIPAKPL